MVNECQSDWDKKIDTVLMGYRASRQASTKQSPYFMLFQHDMKLPIDMEILPQAQHLDQQDPNAISARIDQLLQSRKEPFKVARSPVFSRSTNLESKLIEFFVFVNFNTQSILRVFIRTFTVVKIGDFPHFLSELPSNNQFIIKLVKM